MLIVSHSGYQSFQLIASLAIALITEAWSLTFQLYLCFEWTSIWSMIWFLSLCSNHLLQVKCVGLVTTGTHWWQMKKWLYTINEFIQVTFCGSIESFLGKAKAGTPVSCLTAMASNSVITNTTSCCFLSIVFTPKSPLKSILFGENKLYIKTTINVLFKPEVKTSDNA